MLTPDARQAVHRTAARLPSMARERLCWAPWTGPTNGRRVSRVMSYPCTSPTRSAVPDDAQTLRCLALLRAARPGHAIHSPALVDLVGRVPGAPPEWPTGSQPTTSCRGPGATCHPWRHGWRSPCIRRDTAPATGRPRTQGAALLTGWPRSRETAPLGVRRMQMMRHDDRQRSDWLGVRRASSADRRAGRGKVHEARIAVDFSESPAEDGDSG